jgi:predicted amidohydrolase YtcJ
MLNGAALHVLGIGEGVSGPVGGSVGRHSTGRLNGIVKDWLPMPQVERATVARSLKATIKDTMRLELARRWFPNRAFSR